LTADLVYLLTLVGALGSGLIAGVFFAFSTFVMRALERLPSAQGVAAMQSINVVVLNPIFLGVFVGIALVCVALIVAALASWPRPGLLIGALLYLLGTFLVTGLFNVPRNQVLAKVEPASAEAGPLWQSYVRTLTAWNHVRTASALAAAAAFTVAL